MKHIGSFSFGHEYIDIYLHKGTDGEFESHQGAGKCAKISIGADCESLNKLFDILFHEVLEYAMWREGCRYSPDDDAAEDCGSYLFSMNHPQFSNVSAKASMAIMECMPKLTRAYIKWQKRKRK